MANAINLNRAMANTVAGISMLNGLTHISHQLAHTSLRSSNERSIRFPCHDHNNNNNSDKITANQNIPLYQRVYMSYYYASTYILMTK